MEETVVDNNVNRDDNILTTSTIVEKSNCNCQALLLQKKLESLEQKFNDFQDSIFKRIEGIEKELLGLDPGRFDCGSGRSKDSPGNREINLSNSGRHMTSRSVRVIQGGKGIPSRRDIKSIKLAQRSPSTALTSQGRAGSNAVYKGELSIRVDEKKLKQESRQEDADQKSIDIKKEPVMTRSGRLSKPNPKFEAILLKQEDDDMEKEHEDETGNIVEFVEHEGQDAVLATVSSLSEFHSARRTKGYASSRHWKFVCEFCSKTFPTEFKRNYHRKMHTENRPFKCEVPGCDAAFKYKTQLSIHLRVHQTIRTYVCTLCDKKYKYRSTFSIHMLMHKQLKLYSCPLCEKKFYTRTHVKRHLRMRHKCGTDFEIEIPKDTSLLPPPAPKIKKEKTRVQRVVERVVCEQCGTSVLKNNFKHHQSTHLVLFSCDQCGKGFSTEFALTSHKTHAHDLEKPFICNFPECESRFTSVSNLKTHLISHSEERLFRCEPCNRSYKHKGGLKVHINSSHSKHKQFPCSTCSKVFDTRTHLKRHMITVHAITKDEAEEITKIKKEIKETAPVERPRVACDLCHKTYKSKHDLRLHKNAAHTKEVNFPCEYCNKVFYRRNHQRRHLQKVHNIGPVETTQQHGKLPAVDLSTTDIDFDETASTSTAVLYDPITESFQLKPGTVVEILEYDGQEFRRIGVDEIGSVPMS